MNWLIGNPANKTSGDDFMASAGSSVGDGVAEVRFIEVDFGQQPLLPKFCV